MINSQIPENCIVLVDVLWNTDSTFDFGTEYFFSLNVYITNNYFKDTVVLPKLTGATNEQLVAAQWVFVPFTFLKTAWCLGKNYIIILINHQYGNGFFIFIDKVLKFTAKDKRIFLK